MQIEEMFKALKTKYSKEEKQAAEKSARRKFEALPDFAKECYREARNRREWNAFNLLVAMGFGHLEAARMDMFVEQLESELDRRPAQ